MRSSLLLLALLLTLPACGVEESDAIGGPAGDSTAQPPPPCSEVWVAGQSLPEDYHGCVTGTNELVDDVQECADGSVLVTHEDRFWAVAGGTVEDTGEVSDGTSTSGGLVADAAYQDAAAACAG